jgi:hypothetical protein
MVANFTIAVASIPNIRLCVRNRGALKFYCANTKIHPLFPLYKETAGVGARIPESSVSPAPSESYLFSIGTQILSLPFSSDTQYFILIRNIINKFLSNFKIV